MSCKLYWMCVDFSRIDYFTSLIHDVFCNLNNLDKNEIKLIPDPAKFSECEMNNNYLIIVGDNKLNLYRQEIIRLCDCAYKTILIADSDLSEGVVSVCNGSKVILLMYNFSEKNDDLFNQEVQDCVKTMNEGKVYFSKMALTVLCKSNNILRSTFDKLNDDEFNFVMCIGIGMTQRQYADFQGVKESYVSKLKNRVLDKVTFINGKHPTFDELLQYTRRIIEDLYTIKLT